MGDLSRIEHDQCSRNGRQDMSSKKKTDEADAPIAAMEAGPNAEPAPEVGMVDAIHHDLYARREEIGIEQMQHVIFNAYTNATLTALFLFVVFSILFYALKVGIAAWGKKERTDKESPFQALPDA